MKMKQDMSMEEEAGDRHLHIPQKPKSSKGVSIKLNTFEDMWNYDEKLKKSKKISEIPCKIVIDIDEVGEQEFQAIKDLLDSNGALYKLVF